MATQSAEEDQTLTMEGVDVVVAGSAEHMATETQRSIRAWIFTKRGMTEEQFSSVSELQWDPKQGVLWLDLDTYTNDDLRELSEQLELDPSGIKAALAPWQRPSVEAFSNHAFINASVLGIDLDQCKVVANEIDCFIGDHFLLLAHNQSLPFLDRMLERAEITAHVIANDPAYLLYILLDELIDAFAAVAEDVDGVIEKLENEALTTGANNFLDTLVAHKRFVYAINRFVSQHSFVFHGLLRPDFPFVSGKNMEGYFAELNGRFATVAGIYDDARQEMLGTFDVYMSSVAHRTNGIVKTLTMISILVLPATAIFGFFGTNFIQLPFFGTIGFIVMFALLFALTAGQILVFRSRGWMS